MSLMRQRKLLAFLSLLGAVIVVLNTNNYGVGLSPDSVKYISTARNFQAGLGLLDYSGTPLVNWPPLYPILLGSIGFIVRSDPLVIAPYINGLLFSLIIYLSGRQCKQIFCDNPLFAWIGIFAVFFSLALKEISLMAWTEPLFIFFICVGFHFANRYLLRRDVLSLFLLSITAASVTLTRYIGVAFILWCMLIILFIGQSSMKKKFTHLIVFSLISSIPLGVWMIRNQSISNSFFGERTQTSTTLLQNTHNFFSVISHWYLPPIIKGIIPLLLFLISFIVIFVSLCQKNHWIQFKSKIKRISPYLLFSIIYSVSIIYLATTTAIDDLDDRLLSPIYIPVTFLLLFLIMVMIDILKGHSSRNILPVILQIICLLSLSYPIAGTIYKGLRFSREGQGYSSISWRESETIRFLKQNQIKDTQCVVYSNGPDAVYANTNFVTKMVLEVGSYKSSEKSVDIAQIKGLWPEEGNACLIWFNNIHWAQLATLDELQSIVNLDLKAQFQDGALYKISKR